MVYMEPWLLGTPVGGRNLGFITSDLKNSGMVFPLLYDQIKVEANNEIKDFGSLDMEDQMDFISGKR